MGITPFILGAAAIGAGGSILAANTQADASQQAANTSAAASQQATQTQLQMYNQTRSDLQPFTQTGYGALSGLSQFLSPSGPIGSLLGSSGPISTLLGLGPNGMSGATSALQNTPGYQFALSQGQQSLDRSAASRGLLLSGGQIKDSQAYGQGLASQLYGTTLSQLGGYAGQLGTYGNEIAGLVNTGESAASQTGNAGSAAANSIGSSLLTGAQQQSTAIQNGGTAAASGIAGAANNIGTLLGNSSLQAYLNPQIDYGAINQGVIDTGNAAYSQLSDRRAKTDIRKIGKAESGLNIYSFRLKGSPITQIGVMSDEVRKVAPDAVRRNPKDGLDRVDYGKVSRLPAIGSTPLKRAA